VGAVALLRIKRLTLLNGARVEYEVVRIDRWLGLNTRDKGVALRVESKIGLVHELLVEG
jgi:hypothetical protein